MSECGICQKGENFIAFKQRSKEVGVLRPVNWYGYIRAIGTEKVIWPVTSVLT